MRATDSSAAALDVARVNAERLGVDVAFVDASWADALEGHFDVIVTNPPYVTTAELAAVDRDVRDFEPRGALLGGDDGLVAYRALLASVCAHTSAARLILEVDPRHADFVAALIATTFPGSRPSAIPNLTGRTRVSTLSCRDCGQGSPRDPMGRRDRVPDRHRLRVGVRPGKHIFLSRIYAIKRRPDGLAHAPGSDARRHRG